MAALKVLLACSEIPTPDQLKFPYLVSYKLDGVRCPQVDGKPMSRKMLIMENLFVQAWAMQHKDLLHGLDGELVVGAPHSTSDTDDVFNRSSGPVGKKEGNPDFTYWVFEQWNAAGPAYSRYTGLQLKMLQLKEAGVPRVKLIEQWLVQGLAELQSRMAEALELGYEGLILKSPFGLYKNGRSTLNENILMKWKEWDLQEAQVLSVNQGTTNTNELKKDELGHAKRSSAKAGKIPRDSIGSWTVRDIRTGVVFNCPPSTQTEEELKKLWHEHQGKSHEGLFVQYKYQKVGSLRKPRFPGMVRFRPKYDIDFSDAKFVNED